MKFTGVFKHMDSFDNDSEELRKMAIPVEQILYLLYRSDSSEVDVHYMGEIDSRNQ